MRRRLSGSAGGPGGLRIAYSRSMRTNPTIRLVFAIAVTLSILAADVSIANAAETSPGDEMIAAYFREETQKLADACLTRVKSFDEWAAQRDGYRQQLREMLGLDPLPERTPLHAVVTGKQEREDFIVEKLHFQSQPHLYVTANLYLPKNITKPAPAILYVCGHHKLVEKGVSYGNKVAYQHHGAWFAQNGYVCLMIDTLQLGEIEGVHHGTYREGMWWWNARGYTPAGVEAWNSIRAIDYLISRPEVDATRIGMTGRSGGGAYSWTTTALDDRIKVAVPVAGITTLKNYVVDSCITGHCDCMFFVNTYRWDYPQLAALTAPRPLLIANTDRDKIFPLDGVTEVYRKVRNLYELGEKGPDVALQLTPGPHSDGQVLQLQALRWFNHYFKEDDSPVPSAAKSYFTPAELKVFDKLPEDQINTKIQESFVPQAAAPVVPNSQHEWESQRDAWLRALVGKCFRAWPAEDDRLSAKPRNVNSKRTGDITVTAYQFTGQNNIDLQLYRIERGDADGRKPRCVILRPLSQRDWSTLNVGALVAPNASDDSGPSPSGTDDELKRLFSTDDLNETAMVFFAPCGIGPTAWSSDPQEQKHIRRKFMLLGQTLDGMRVWDVRRAIQSLRKIDGFTDLPLTVRADDEMAGIALYAALFEPNVDRLDLHGLPHTHRNGPDFLNVLRILDVPQTVAMVAEKTHVDIHQDGSDGWDYPLAVAKRFGWNERIAIMNDSQHRAAGGDTKSK